MMISSKDIPTAPGTNFRDWSCDDCSVKDKLNRNCPLPRYKDLDGERATFRLRLANNSELKTCPVGSIDEWASDICEEYIFSKEFGFSSGVDITNKRFHALLVVAGESAKCQNLEIERIKRKRNG